MKKRTITEAVITRFRQKLTEDEKSEATKEKYLRDVRAFSNFCKSLTIDKENVIAYKQKLLDDGYAVRSVNSMLASLNSLFAFLRWYDLRVKALKVQQQIFRPEEKELTRTAERRKKTV